MRALLTSGRARLTMAACALALSVSFGGVAYASNSVGGSPRATAAKKKKKKPKPPANDNANDAALFNALLAASDDAAKDVAEISAYLAGHSVPNANHASTADTAGHAATADSATNAANAQPVAFAHVDRSSSLDAANSKNMTLIGGAHPYCLSGIPFTPRGGQATADAGGFGGGDYATFGLGRPTGCPAGTQAYVFIWSPGSPPTTTDDGFFVTVYG